MPYVVPIAAVVLVCLFSNTESGQRRRWFPFRTRNGGLVYDLGQSWGLFTWCTIQECC